MTSSPQPHPALKGNTAYEGMDLHAMRGSFMDTLRAWGVSEGAVEGRCAGVEDPSAVEHLCGASWWDYVVQRYGEPWRHYHTMHHVSDMWHLWRANRAALEDPAAVLMAIFFHDLVYDPHSKTNESDSAVLWDCFRQQVLRSLPAHEAPSPCLVSSHVFDWIMRTASHPNVSEPTPAARARGPVSDEEWFLDFDLAILARPRRRYDSYARQVALEYAHVHWLAFAYGRASFLSRLETQARAHHLFHSPVAQRQHWHDAAVANVCRERAALTSTYRSAVKLVLVLLACLCVSWVWMSTLVVLLVVVPTVATVVFLWLSFSSPWPPNPQANAITFLDGEGSLQPPTSTSRLGVLLATKVRAAQHMMKARPQHHVQWEQEEALHAPVLPSQSQLHDADDAADDAHDVDVTSDGTPCFSDNHYFQLVQPEDGSTFIWMRLAWRPHVVETSVWVRHPGIAHGTPLTLWSPTDVPNDDDDHEDGDDHDDGDVDVDDDDDVGDTHELSDVPHSWPMSTYTTPWCVPIVDRRRNTSLKVTPLCHGAGPLLMTCEVPNQRWSIRVSPCLLRGGGGTCVWFRAHLTFRVQHTFHFTTDTCASTMASFLAQADWSLDFFKHMQHMSQHRYEHGGAWSGYMEWQVAPSTSTSTASTSTSTSPAHHVSASQPLADAWKRVPVGTADAPLLRGVHSHNYGPRDWGQFENWRYHMATFADGSYVHMTCLRRSHFPNLVAGYVYRPTYERARPIVRATGVGSFPDSQPERYTFAVEVSGSSNTLTIAVRVNTRVSPVIRFGDADVRLGQSRAMLLEGDARFELRDGDAAAVGGSGLAEWGFTEAEYTIPQWVQ